MLPFALAMSRISETFGSYSPFWAPSPAVFRPLPFHLSDDYRLLVAAH